MSVLTALNSKDLEKPQNLRERRSFYRFFYNSVPEIGTGIDEHSIKKCSLKSITDCRAPEQKNYIYDFFNKMCGRLNIVHRISEILHEYLIMGNCTVFVEEDSSTKSKKVTKYDKNPDYLGWKKIIILPPDQVWVRKLPLSDEIILDFLPDPDTLNFLKKSKNKLLKSLVQGHVPLDQDPSSGSFAHLFARKITQYDVIGISPIEKHVEDLIFNDKVRNHEGAKWKQTKEKKITMKISKTESDLLNRSIEKFVEESLFKPVAIKKGFLSPNGTVIYPAFKVG